MKKIPCLFQRDFIPRPIGRGSSAVMRKTVADGLDVVLNEGQATAKIDGTACAVIEQEGYMAWVPLELRSSLRLFRRYDAKHGKPAPANGIPCDDPDPETDHWPHWIPVGEEPESKWMREAYLRRTMPLLPGTYEFAGPHVQGNPHMYADDRFVMHGSVKIEDHELERTFDGIYRFLATHSWEGIVFWLGGEPRAKIRRKDYGLSWPISGRGL